MYVPSLLYMYLLSYICTLSLHPLSYACMCPLTYICNGLDQQAFFRFLGRFVAKALYDRQVSDPPSSQS